MGDDEGAAKHAAEAAVLGFYYQTFFALFTLMVQTTDSAAVGIERLDDIELRADGHTLLYQLKHSLSVSPPPITLGSRALWRTVKVWIDILPAVTLWETNFHLVSVGSIPNESPLKALTSPGSDRAELLRAMTQEAGRVMDARRVAAAENKALPYSDKADGCEAFLSLSETEQLNFLRRVEIKSDSPTIEKIEQMISENLKILPSEQRAPVAKRLVEWWDRQALYSLCNIRPRFVTRTELQQQIMEIVGDIEQARLVPDFETVTPPEDYQPHGMLFRQIELVEGKKSDHSRAIREEWKAREQRSKWLNDDPAMAAKINDYDILLGEHWSDRHCQMVENCTALAHGEKCLSGLRLLRWTHEEAPNAVRPFSEGWNAAYYVRGSYQVLAINLKVGWHPDYKKLLEDGE